MEDFENFGNGNEPFMAMQTQKRHNPLDFKPNFQTKRGHDIDDYYYL